jgi:hypothetical protein
MSPHVESIAKRLQEVERDLEREVDEQQQRWHYRLDRGRAWFDHERREAHRRLKQRVPAYIREASLLNLLTAPVIYSLLLPFALVDVWVTLYQWVCFPIYRIPRVRRRAYFVIDRHRLAYLNGIEKINCTFCSYANGVIAYVREVASCTEQYWCPIKHSRHVVTPHARYHAFVDYGNAEGYRNGLPSLRQTLSRRR